MKVAVIGASGFVGGAVVEALRRRGFDITPLSAPRLAPMARDEGIAALHSNSIKYPEFVRALEDSTMVVNAAGVPDASSKDAGVLTAVNAILPVVLARSAANAGVRRFVHISSAAVQGRLPALDESTKYDEFSEYAKSKILGEQLLLQERTPELVIYRPPSVHAADRRVTRSLARIATSPLSSVAAPGTARTPQAHIANVGDAAAFLATTPHLPPRIVMHPWEGLSTGSLLVLLGDGRPPRQVPPQLARAVVRVARFAARRFRGSPTANVRRLEMVWFGQEQSSSALERLGWTPPAGREEWRYLGRQVREGSLR